MAIRGEYLGMGLTIDDLDVENLEYFRHCADHDFHLQACAGCGRLRYPPTTACPWCATLESVWKKVEGKGPGHSYSEVHHAIQPAFRSHTPYLILLVDLDTQKGEPTPTKPYGSSGICARRTASWRRRTRSGASASGPACAWCSAMSPPVSRCRNGRSTRPRRSPPTFGDTPRSSTRPW